ncbi:unnamed protein product [Clonostachys byssicola]|uniref:Alpha/beta hydrolase fold-3 domain-containing protein n=1 Tax=Clonostachys byssicola TaxID=160290 RepID=A0A9N9UL16_9HYPO|nr:unnamed protein product [Clonostachys byssicola]
MVSLTEGQKAALSPEAITFLEHVHHLPFAGLLSSFLTMPNRVPSLRQGVEVKMAPGEADLIAKHGLQLKEIIIANVPVVVIEPPVIHPEKESKILFNIFGGAFIMGSPRDRAALTMAAELGIPVDLSGAGDSMVFNARDRDIMPYSLLYSMVAQNYFEEGVDLKDPLVSPIYASYDTWFPRTVITVGTRDFALSNGIRFHWKLREAGVETELLVSEGMWHGFVWDPVVPEAQTARAAVIKFMQNKNWSRKLWLLFTFSCTVSSI